MRVRLPSYCPSSLWANSVVDSIRHGLINYIDITANWCHLKKLTCKGTLRQLFFRVYILEIQSVMWVFRPSFVNCYPSNILAAVPPPPIDPFPVWKKSQYTRIHTVCKGEYGVLGIRQINTGRKVSLHVKFFRWQHFALPFLSLNFLRLK
jgi:hypothetical protein